MKAIVHNEHGPPVVLQLQEVEKALPRDREVLAKIYATTVTIGDTIMRSLNLPVSGWQKFIARLFQGILKPKRPILGMELAGEVESVGRNRSSLYQGTGDSSIYQRQPCHDMVLFRWSKAQQAWSSVGNHIN